MRHTRQRYQHGSLTIEKRSNGPDVWVYRWREPVGDGQTIQRKRIIGTVKEFTTESAAHKAVDALRLDINAEAVSGSPMTIRELVEHYTLTELADNLPEHRKKTALTKKVYRHHLETQIVPKWGDHQLGAIKAFRVEEWLDTLPHAPSTKAKTRNIMFALYKHAIRFGWAERNPIQAVRQSGKRLQEPDILTPDEVSAIFADLPLFGKAAVLIAATTGLRRGELFGLRWEDVDLENRTIRIVRSIVDQVEGEPKTAGSKRPMPIPTVVVDVLLQWRAKARYSGDGDWVFASDYHLGRHPLWPDAVLKRHILPAAEAAGIAKRIGWHSFRRTFATLLTPETDVKTLQELMRHATPNVSLGLYSQAITEEKRRAQDKITELFKLPLTA